MARFVDITPNLVLEKSEPGRKVHSLSSIDRCVPQSLLHLILVFPFPDLRQSDAAAQVIGQGLAALMKRWTFLSGQLPPLDSRDERTDSCYVEYPRPWTVNARHVFKCLLATAPSSLDYDRMSKLGMPVRDLDVDLLCITPSSLYGTVSLPGAVFTLQATFVTGGLYLGLSFQRAVFDSSSIELFVGSLTEAIRARSTLNCEDIQPCTRQSPALYIPEDDAVERGREVRSATLEDFDFSHANDASNPTIKTKTKVAAFTSAKVAKMRELIGYILEAPGEAPSERACLLALVWIAVIRIREKRLAPQTLTKFGVQVDLRARLKPPVEHGYLGNLFSSAIAQTRVQDLVDMQLPEALQESITIQTVAKAARLIEQSTSKVDAEHAHDRLGRIGRIVDWADAQKASRTGFLRHAHDVVSDLNVVSNLESFDIPGIAAPGNPHWCRIAGSSQEGIVNILPRTGLPDADWEVQVTLRTFELSAVVKDVGRTGWHKAFY